MAARPAAWGMLLAMMASVPVFGDVITHFPADEKVVALTFDGCEAKGHPAYLDQSLVAVLQAEKVPFTLFAGGLFASRNADALRSLAQSPLVEIENHSQSHPMHMERLDDAAALAQVNEAQEAIEAVTGRRPKYFRFPAGNYDERVLKIVEDAGLKVVHWRFPSGDPAKGITPQEITHEVLTHTKPGDVLIFHINGRAPATHLALPEILNGLRAKGYRFVRLDEVLP